MEIFSKINLSILTTILCLLGENLAAQSLTEGFNKKVKNNIVTDVAKRQKTTSNTTSRKLGIFCCIRNQNEESAYKRRTHTVSKRTLKNRNNSVAKAEDKTSLNLSPPTSLGFEQLEYQWFQSYCAEKRFTSVHPQMKWNIHNLDIVIDILNENIDEFMYYQIMMMHKRELLYIFRRRLLLENNSSTECSWEGALFRDALSSILKFKLNKYVPQWCLQNNNIKIRIFFALLPIFDSLEYLVLENINLKHSDVRLLCAILLDCKFTLRSLVLRDISLYGDCIKDFFSFLYTQTSLMRLELRNCDLQSTVFQELVKIVEQNVSSLKVLDLTGNQFTPENFMLKCKLYCFTKLHTLNLGDNARFSINIPVRYQFLIKFDNLCELNLDGFLIDKLKFEPIHQKESYKLPLHELSLCNTCWGFGSIKYLFEFLATQKVRLRTLSLRNIDWLEQAADFFTKYSSVFAEVYELDLSDNRISSFATLKIVNALKKGMFSVKKIVMKRCTSKPTNFTSIFQVLMNQNSQKLCIDFENVDLTQAMIDILRNSSAKISYLKISFDSNSFNEILPANFSDNRVKIETLHIDSVSLLTKEANIVQNLKYFIDSRLVNDVEIGTLKIISRDSPYQSNGVLKKFKVSKIIIENPEEIFCLSFELLAQHIEEVEEIECDFSVRKLPDKAIIAILMELENFPCLKSISLSLKSLSEQIVGFFIAHIKSFSALRNLKLEVDEKMDVQRAMLFFRAIECIFTLQLFELVDPQKFGIEVFLMYLQLSQARRLCELIIDFESISLPDCEELVRYLSFIEVRRLKIVNFNQVSLLNELFCSLSKNAAFEHLSFINVTLSESSFSHLKNLFERCYLLRKLDAIFNNFAPDFEIWNVLLTNCTLLERCDLNIFLQDVHAKTFREFLSTHRSIKEIVVDWFEFNWINKKGFYCYLTERGAFKEVPEFDEVEFFTGNYRLIELPE